MASTRDRTSQVDPFRDSCSALENALFVVWGISYHPPALQVRVKAGQPRSENLAVWARPQEGGKRHQTWSELGTV